MNISMKDFKLPLFSQAAQSKSAKERSERKQNMEDQVSALENRKAGLKNRKCDTLEEIGEKLEMYHTYEAEIAEIKKSYNMTEAMHVTDEAEERGEQIAEAAENTKPKTKEERRKEAIEEATGVEQSLLTKLLEENAVEDEQFDATVFVEEFDFAANQKAMEEQLDDIIQNQPFSYLQELGKICKQLRETDENSDRQNSFSDHVTRMACAYAQLSRRIDEEFDDPAREHCYLTEDGTRIERTREQEKEQLLEAYNSFATLAAVSARIMTEIRQHYHGEFSDLDPEEVQENAYRTYQDAISDENLLRLQEKVESIRNYKLNFSVGQDWLDIIGRIIRRN